MISKTAANTLRDTYVGQVITIYLQGMNVVTVNEEQQEISITAMAQGLCVHIDQDYIHLGTEDGEIIRSVQHELGQMIEIEFVGSEFMDTDMPAQDEDVH